MLSLIACLIILVVVSLLLSGRVFPFVALSLVPTLGALASGFSFREVSDFYTEGSLQVMPIAVMFMFSILYFGIMNDMGLFKPLITGLIKHCRGSKVAITIGTVLIAIVAHLDGSGSSTFLMTIPPLIPLYDSMKIDRRLLLLLVCASASVMNMLPWGGPLGRASSVIKMDPMEFWSVLVFLQLIAICLVLLMSIYLGRREERKGNQGELSPRLADDPLHSTTNSRLYWINLALTLFMLAVLFTGALPSALVFMLAVSLALWINYPGYKQQADCVKSHAGDALILASIIVSAGAFLGILDGSGMLNSLSNDIVAILPASIIPKLHVIIGFLGVPMEMLLNTDAYYFALLPVIEQTVGNHGVESFAIASAMTIGNVIGIFISPFSPALWLGLGLAQVNIGAHIRYSFLWIWGLSAALMVFAMLLKIF